MKAGIAGMDDPVRFPVVAKNYYVLSNVQTTSGAHTVSYAVGTGGASLPGDKAEVENIGTMPVRGRGGL
jgi:hypothetical protein